MNLKYDLDTPNKYFIKNKYILFYGFYDFVLPAGMKDKRYFGITFYWESDLKEIYNDTSGIKIKEQYALWI